MRAQIKKMGGSADTKIAFYGIDRQDRKIGRSDGRSERSKRSKDRKDVKDRSISASPSEQAVGDFSIFLPLTPCRS